MLLPFVGKARERALRELSDNWLPGDIPVALLEGFSGCGKSVLAGDLLDRAKIPTARVDASESDHDLQDLFLDLAIALEAVGIDALSSEAQKGAQANFAGALREVVRRSRVLLIIDEAEHTFVHNAARPASKLAGVVQQLGNSKATGKLLLISNRLAEHAVWSENCFRVRLPPLEEHEAVALLSQLLEHQKRSDKVDPTLKPELVRCFGCNPRAIHTLVTSLEFETLDHLITSMPGMWDLRDIEVSPHLVAQLERDLLGRILPKLEDEKGTAKFLRWLSVHRQPFRKEALEEFRGAGFASAELLQSLVERMLLEYRHGWHTLNAIAREVSVQRLKEATSEWTQAHSLAANYHARHFRAQQIVQAERLAGSYAELRYHLYQAGRLDELEGLSQRYTTFIRRSINITQVPSNRAKLDEQIALLTVLLATQGAKTLEYHLARCLLKRNAPGDRKAALDHIRRATGPQAPFGTWLIRIDLEWEFAGAIAAQLTWREGLRCVSPSGNAYTIYQRAGELLARDGDLNGAVALLRKGIAKIPPEFNQFALYRQCGGLLARGGDLQGAIILLREGIAKIPPEFSQFSLYQLCGELLARQDDIEGALSLLREGIAKIPAEFSRFSLYQLCAELLARQGDLKGAISLLQEGIAKIPPEFGQFSLYQICVELLARDGDLKGALTLLEEGIAKIPPEFSQSSLYQLGGDVLMRHGDFTGAITLLRKGYLSIPSSRGSYRLLEAALRLAAHEKRKDIIKELITFSEPGRPSDPFIGQRYFGECLILWMEDDWGGVLAAADKGLQMAPSLSLRVMKTEAHIGLGDLDAAWMDMEFVEPSGKFPKGSSALWLKAWIALKTKRQREADLLVLQYSGDAVKVEIPVTESILVRLWSLARGGLNESITTFFRSLRPWLGTETNDIARPRYGTTTPIKANVASQCFLVVTTEWDSKNGGLSTFNRMLCRALAKAKHEVFCYVPTASEDEIRRAATDGVTLVASHAEAGVSPMATLFNPPDEIKSLAPDFLIGHDRQSGGYAKALQKFQFPKSKRIHFIHTAPEEIEPSKPSRVGTAAKRGEERVKEQKDQAREAVLIVGVGPRLAREFGNHIYGAGYAPIYEINPGFDLDDETPDVAGPIVLPPGIVCLVLGRVEDYDLKGLDLAAQSMAAVADSWKPMALPRLVVRGAPLGTGDELYKKLRRDIHSKRPLPLTVREYSQDLEAIQNDLRGSSLLLMPSCVEGFGLVAAEAICMGVPVLISEQSGIAEILPNDLRDNILPTRPDALTPLDPNVTKKWAEAIARILNGKEKAFATARQLKVAMAAKYTWQEAIRGLLDALGVTDPKEGN